MKELRTKDTEIQTTNDLRQQPRTKKLNTKRRKKFRSRTLNHQRANDPTKRIKSLRRKRHLRRQKGKTR
jgi:hypothetical protein